MSFPKLRIHLSIFKCFSKDRDTDDKEKRRVKVRVVSAGDLVTGSCPGSESWWVLHLSHSNTLPCSNLGNVNLQSPETLRKSDENSGTTFYLNHTNLLRFTVFPCLICGWKGDCKCYMFSIMRCVFVRGWLHLYVSLCEFLLPSSVWWTYRSCGGRVKMRVRGAGSGENSSSRWREAGRRVHFLTELTCSANRGNLLHFSSLTHTHTHTHRNMCCY